MIDFSYLSSFAASEVALMLGVNRRRLEEWQIKNTQVGAIKYGPPYEYRGPDVVYPKEAFRVWCAQVRRVGGVPRMDLPISATIALPWQDGNTCHVQHTYH